MPKKKPTKKCQEETEYTQQQVKEAAEQVAAIQAAEAQQMQEQYERFAKGIQLQEERGQAEIMKCAGDARVRKTKPREQIPQRSPQWT